MKISTNENDRVIAEPKVTPPRSSFASKENALCGLEISQAPTVGRQNSIHLIKLKAKVGGVMVGEVFIRRTPDLSYDLICSLYVLPSHRRCGIGRSLMEKAIEDFGKERELRLRAKPGFSDGSAPGQNDLIGFYYSLGFASFDDAGNMKRSTGI
jgi:GNAT superfamily N-acetyltransferase